MRSISTCYDWLYFVQFESFDHISNSAVVILNFFHMQLSNY